MTQVKPACGVPVMENRDGTRESILALVGLCRFTSIPAAEEFKGEIRNCSPGGVCIETTEALDPGSVLILKVIHTHFESYPSEITEYMRMCSLAEVKWSKPIDSPGRWCYSMGMRYLYT